MEANSITIFCIVIEYCSNSAHELFHARSSWTLFEQYSVTKQKTEFFLNVFTEQSEAANVLATRSIEWHGMCNYTCHNDVIISMEKINLNKRILQFVEFSLFVVRKLLN